MEKKTMKQFTHTLLSLAAVIFLAASGAISAQESHDPKVHDKNGGSIALSADLHRLLAEEMAAIQSGMSQLSFAIAAGQWEEIVEIAKKIEASYILKQKLTTTQKEELHNKLPERFRRLDKKFHETAGWLAHAAKMRHVELVPFFYYKLTESCVNCHSVYATKRFPGLADKDAVGHHH